MKLEEYLQKEDLNAAQFARRVKLSHQTIYSLMNGRDCRGSVIAKIQKYTKKKVSFEDFYPDI